MSSTKWTPWPWKAIEGRSIPFSIVESADGYVVCRFWNSMDPGVIYKDNETNAHLIAAAPELYDALEALLNMVDREHGRQYSGLQSVAASALAKARGEAPHA